MSGGSVGTTPGAEVTSLETWTHQIGRVPTWMKVLLGWVVFLGLLWWRGGPTIRDDHVILYSAWMMAHGGFDCAYRVPAPARDYPLSAPLFSLLNSGLQWLTRVGFSRPFPLHALSAGGCHHDYAVVNGWLRGTTTARRTLWLGTFVWPLLATSCISLVRARRQKVALLEWILVGALALWPTWSLPFLEYYHPEDVLALAALLASLASAERARPALAGVFAGLAFLSQQNVALGVVVVFVMLTTRREWWRFLRASALTAALVVVPLVTLSGFGALHAALTGTGLNDNPVYSTWMGELGIYGNHALLISRAGPLLLGALGLWWWLDRVGRPSPHLVLDLLACTFALRLVLEENLWSYYSLGLVTCWLVVDLREGRRRVVPWMWALVVSGLPWLSSWPLVSALPVARAPLWMWQAVLLPLAVLVSARPLWNEVRSRRGVDETVVVTPR